MKYNGCSGTAVNLMKHNLRFHLLILLMLLSLTLPACSDPDKRAYINFKVIDPEAAATNNQPQPIDADNLLRIAVCATLSQQDTIEAYRLISSHISTRMGRETVLLERKSYAEINVLLANGGADVAFLANGAYNSYTSVEDIEPLVMQVRFGVPYYFSYIIVHEDSTIQTLEDLRGRTFAFTDPLSFSGYLVPVHMLRQIAEKPENLFSNYIFTYSHEKSLAAVAGKVVDGAAIGSHVYSESQEKRDGLAGSVRILAVSEKSGTGPVVVRKSLGADAIGRLKTIFLQMHQEAELREAMDSLLVDYYIEPDMTLYDFPRKVIDELGEK